MKPRGSRGLAWRVFLTCWLIYTAFWTPYIVREHFPAMTLAENGTLNVEPYLGWSDDIFRSPKGGAFINNNPGASLTGAIPLLLFRPLLIRVDKWNQTLPRPPRGNPGDELFSKSLAAGRAYYFLLVAFLTVALAMAPATAGTAAYLCSRLTQAGVPPAQAAIAALLYGLATPVFFRAGHLNHNLLVCDAAFTALLLLSSAFPGLSTHQRRAYPRSAEPAPHDAASPCVRPPGLSTGQRRAVSALPEPPPTTHAIPAPPEPPPTAAASPYDRPPGLSTRQSRAVSAPHEPLPTPPSARAPSLRLALAGLLAGYSLLCDFSGLVVIASLAFYLCLRPTHTKRWHTLAIYACAVLPGVLALAVYQQWAFGSLFRPPQNYMPPTAPTSLGYRGFSWPSPALAWANFFDPRFGLFAYCPALLLALAAPFVRRVRYQLPRKEMWVLLVYFGLFVVFCAANQYSWLQPLTGFRYLVPVVPALALLAMQTAQILPKPARIFLAVASCAQSLLMAAAHANDIRLPIHELGQRKFQLLWMIRLRDAGAPVTGAWPPVLLLTLAAALTAIWLSPLSPKSRAESNASGGVT